MWILIFFIVIWYSSLFCQTFFQHRYAAHRAFRMNKFWERVFFIFTYITQGSSYMSPRTYGILHRMHHAYTDTEKDPHSPEFSKNVFQMMLRTRNIYNKIHKGKVQVEERFTHNLPEWLAFDKIASSPLSRILWSVAYLALFLLLSPTLWWLLLLPVVITMGAFHGAIINWYAHKYGYTNFKLKNTSQNLLVVDVLMLGESYHNNHHKNPNSINFGKRWHELDPVYPLIRFLAWCRIIKLRNQPQE
ncbi:acyl-CoA desaturase [Pseudobacter ginsenosidimutans]|uniref:Stearoyl-CoA desaturase (Delta-9 desaturase) n=1 Tax=Pseudobacter ginsenosidimutans TaxID=661488 RepID=A0A4Q7N552_9BACT|nr:acyl-CoA desaturase [Pseudobacter ginsenosidimutans]QEC44670.1 acyl-CoA desaturase [Pseudobacter ginsenosidimutans]RZS76151.1 stearoyl-CoA desaturase (delta-9 desaturase) [Pseudobacter ginsenosidimutans]